MRGSMPPGADVEMGKMGQIVEQSAFDDDWRSQKNGVGVVGEAVTTGDYPRSSWSGKEARAKTPTLRNQQYYEEYALRQLSQHRYGRSLTSEKAYQEMQDPGRRHDFDNSVSLPLPCLPPAEVRMCGCCWTDLSSSDLGSMIVHDVLNETFYVITVYQELDVYRQHSLSLSSEEIDVNMRNLQTM